MGQTHHWRRPTELPAEQFRNAVADCRKLLDSAKDKLGGFDGTGSPILRDDRIVFNGRTPQTCEPLEIAVVEFDRRGRPEFWSFCKTDHLPYALYVKAALIIFHHHLHPLFVVASEDKDWSIAKTLVQATLGYGDSFALATE